MARVRGWFARSAPVRALSLCVVHACRALELHKEMNEHGLELPVTELLEFIEVRDCTARALGTPVFDAVPTVLLSSD